LEFSCFDPQPNASFDSRAYSITGSFAMTRGKEMPFPVIWHSVFLIIPYLFKG
jgi:hypothetical protein